MSRICRSFALTVMIGGVACTGTIDAGPKGLPGTGGTTGTTSGTGGHSSTGTASGGTNGGGVTATGGVTSSTGGNVGSGSSAGGTAAYSDIPCNVAAVLQANCSSCHGTTPAFGAPMSLVHAADFGKLAPGTSQTVGQAVIARINDDAHPMPPVPNARLSAADTSTLTTWIQGGAKAGSCAATQSPDGGAMIAPDTDPPGADCYNITARTPTGDKFSVPNTPNLYHCFSYAPPWGSAKVHLISWRPMVDNKAVIHHWLLYNETSPVTDKTDVDCVGAHPNAQLTAGWAPGGTGLTLPADVGEDVSGAGFTLETHYNNTGSGPAPDASGVRVCVTKNLRPNEAGMHWLGTELILLPAGGQASGTCVPKNTGPVTIISSTPHEHLQGRHMTTIINRANGTKETLIDKPFDFNSQIGYLTPTTIMPGDTLTTTCTYGGAAIYGEGTNNEMCYNFVLAYPNGGLADGAVPALRQNGCTGL